MLSHLEKTFSENNTIKELREFDKAHKYIEKQIINKINRSKDTIYKKFEVIILYVINFQDLVNQLKNNIDNYFENYKKIILNEHQRKNELNIQNFDFNPSEKFSFIQTQLNKIKNENKNVNVNNFKNIYKGIFKINADLR